MKTEKTLVDVNGCSSCGLIHIGLQFFELRKPEWIRGYLCEGFSLCPVDSQTIFFTITNNQMKVSDLIIFFFPESEKEYNNHSQIAPAIVNRTWSEDTINLSVLTDGGAISSKSSCRRATCLKEAKEGNRWATVEQAESMGIDLSDPYYKFPEEVVEDVKKEAPESAAEDLPATAE